MSGCWQLLTRTRQLGVKRPRDTLARHTAALRNTRLGTRQPCSVQLQDWATGMQTAPGTQTCQEDTMLITTETHPGDGGHSHACSGTLEGAVRCTALHAAARAWPAHRADHGDATERCCAVGPMKVRLVKRCLGLAEPPILRVVVPDWQPVLLFEDMVVAELLLAEPGLLHQHGAQLIHVILLDLHELRGHVLVHAIPGAGNNLLLRDLYDHVVLLLHVIRVGLHPCFGDLHSTFLWTPVDHFSPDFHRSLRHFLELLHRDEPLSLDDLFFFVALHLLAHDGDLDSLLHRNERMLFDSCDDGLCSAALSAVHIRRAVMLRVDCPAHGRVSILLGDSLSCDAPRCHCSGLWAPKKKMKKAVLRGAPLQLL
mmetsp:Transcript_50643/g.133169  ORF Transcript_50643/g.133169 Transcript_50643/m.133169 type:complete len:369 (+) Transcript_50643:197-1303(+)